MLGCLKAWQWEGLSILVYDFEGFLLGLLFEDSSVGLPASIRVG